MRTANIDLIEMGHATVASCNGDVFQLYIHVVLGCHKVRSSLGDLAIQRQRAVKKGRDGSSVVEAYLPRVSHDIPGQM